MRNLRKYAWWITGQASVKTHKLNFSQFLSAPLLNLADVCILRFGVKCLHRRLLAFQRFKPDLISGETDCIYEAHFKWSSTQSWLISIQNMNEENGHSSWFLFVSSYFSVLCAIRCLKIGTYMLKRFNKGKISSKRMLSPFPPLMNLKRRFFCQRVGGGILFETFRVLSVARGHSSFKLTKLVCFYSSVGKSSCQVH